LREKKGELAGTLESKSWIERREREKKRGGGGGEAYLSLDPADLPPPSPDLADLPSPLPDLADPPPLYPPWPRAWEVVGRGRKCREAMGHGHGEEGTGEVLTRRR
jgi:hypothetical protein